MDLRLERRPNIGLVEAQGGEINYESEAGEGSTFTFTLTPV